MLNVVKGYRKETRATVKVTLLLMSWCEPVQPLQGCGTGENCHTACLSTTPPPTHLSPCPFLQYLPLVSSSFCFLFLFHPAPPFFQAASPHGPTHSMRRIWSSPHSQRHYFIAYPHTQYTPTFLSTIPSPCSPWSPPHPALPTTLLPGRNVFLSLSYTIFTQFSFPSTYSSIPHTLGPADPLREEVGEFRVGNNTITVGQTIRLIH